MIGYLVHIFIILSIAFALRPDREFQKFYWIGLLFKALAGLVLGFLYLEWLGTGDSLFFHHQASELYQLSEQATTEYLNRLFTPQYPVYKGEARNELFVKILSVFYFISGGSYWISSLYLSFISFLGAWYLVVSIQKAYPRYFITAVFAFLFFPSPVFWSSGVLKDPLINASVLFLAGISIRYCKNLPYHWWEIIATIFALHLLFYLRFYLYALAIFTLGALLWFRITAFFFSSRSVKTGVNLFAMVILLLLVTRANRNLNINQLPVSVYTNYQKQISDSEPGKTILFSNLEPTWGSLIIHIPESFLSGLFRPVPFEGAAGPYGLLWIENAFIIVLFLINFYFIKRAKGDALTGILIFYIVVLAAFLPLVAPNIGTLSRYKAAYLPFLVFLLLRIPYMRFLSKEK